MRTPQDIIDRLRRDPGTFVRLSDPRREAWNGRGGDDLIAAVRELETKGVIECAGGMSDGPFRVRLRAAGGSAP